MDDQSKEKGKAAKKLYQKPVIKQVPLRPEEAVLGFCKNSSTTGPALATCTTLGGCSTVGS